MYASSYYANSFYASSYYAKSGAIVIVPIDFVHLKDVVVRRVNPTLTGRVCNPLVSATRVVDPTATAEVPKGK